MVRCDTGTAGLSGFHADASNPNATTAKESNYKINFLYIKYLHK
jgi:hypothetical protein